MKRTLIIIGGKAPVDISFLDLSFYDEIIAADSGYDRAKEYKIKPDIVVGDMDSTEYSDEIRKKGVFFSPCDKDDSDFALAIRRAGDSEYDLIGGGEGRLDHSIAIFSAFTLFRPPRLWLTREDVIFSSSDFQARLEKDTILSFFPADLRESVLVSTEGLVWNLREKEVSLGFISLSNRAEEDEIRIKASKALFIRFSMDFFSSRAKIITC